MNDSNEPEFFTALNNLKAEDHTKDIPEETAIEAILLTGQKYYPYGFELNVWDGHYKSQRFDDGSWLISVDSVRTDMNGDKKKAICTAFINNQNKTVENFGFTMIHD